MDRMRNVRMICIFGSGEKDCAYREPARGVTRIARPEGHHRDGKSVGDVEVDALER
jgi:type IV secretory pathway VirJ component